MQVTETTVLEVWACTAQTDSAWKKFQNVMQLPKLNLSQAAMNARELEYVESLYPNRWGGSYNAYRSTRMFFKEATKTTYNTQVFSEAAATTEEAIWDGVRNRMQAHADLAKTKDGGHIRVVNKAWEMFTALRDHEEAIVDIVVMLIPRRGLGWGACSFLPQGLPALKIKDGALRQLVQKMAGTASCEGIMAEVIAEQTGLDSVERERAKDSEKAFQGQEAASETC